MAPLSMSWRAVCTAKEGVWAATDQTFAAGGLFHLHFDLGAAEAEGAFDVDVFPGFDDLEIDFGVNFRMREVDDELNLFVL
jgi:hypothetical protein